MEHREKRSRVVRLDPTRVKPSQVLKSSRGDVCWVGGSMEYEVWAPALAAWLCSWEEMTREMARDMGKPSFGGANKPIRQRRRAGQS